MSRRRKHSRLSDIRNPDVQAKAGVLSKQDSGVLAAPKRAAGGIASQGSSAQRSVPYSGPRLPLSYLAVAATISVLVLAWSYWPTWSNLVNLWEREPDYSHGWFVIPIASYLLWTFRGSMPPLQSQLSWGGILILAFVAMTRVFARFAYFDFLDGWTIPISVFALIWVFGGRSLAYWSLPAVGFLFFMIPLPFRVENELSQPLQWIATNASCYTLQLLGQPAIAEGTTILLGDQILEVERACSGLRIFMGVFALAYVYAVLVRRSWWERVLLVLAAIPIALVSNAARIVATGLCFQWFSGETARHFAHDLAGYVMIVFAAGLFGLTLLYLRWLVQDAQTMDQASLQRV
jgi:exosortase